MKQLHPRYLSLLLPAAILAFSLFGCGQNSSVSPASPFSDINWDNTIEEIKKYEGSDYTTYASVYGGLCYTYPKAFENHQGTIKYMLDEENRLKSIAFACPFEAEQELYNFYGLLEESINAENPNETSQTTNSGHIWYREEGNIVLSLMVTSDLKALQCAYLHPDVSSKAE